MGKSRKEKDSKQTETERGGGGEIAKTGEAKEAEEILPNAEPTCCCVPGVDILAAECALLSASILVECSFKLERRLRYSRAATIILWAAPAARAEAPNGRWAPKDLFTRR